MVTTRASGARDAPDGTSKEAVHLQNLASELGIASDAPIDLSCDNRSAIDVAYNPEHHTTLKVKHATCVLRRQTALLVARDVCP